MSMKKKQQTVFKQKNETPFPNAFWDKTLFGVIAKNAPKV